MPRTSLTKTTPRGAFGTYSADSADVTFTAADTVNLNQFRATGNNLVIARNTGGSAYTVTITSTPVNGRSGDIATYSIGAGETAVFGPFLGNQNGWTQSDGYVYLQASNAAVTFAVIAI
jgi:hypothetical protein